MLARALVLAAVVTLVPVPAHADAARAWTAAKDNLPAATTILVGVNLTSITKSALFTQLFPLLLAQQPQAKHALELVKSACKIDPLTAIQGVVVGTDDAQKHGAAYFALAGLDQAKIVGCIELMMRGAGATEKVAATTHGAITELTIGPDKVYVGWIGSDVLVIPFEINDLSALDRWMGQKGQLAKSTVAKSAARIDTSAAAWGVSAVPRTEAGLAIKLGYGAVTFSAGNLALDMHVGLANAKAAKAAAARTNVDLANATKSGQLAPDLAKALEAIAVTAKGDELLIKAAIGEDQLMGLLTAML